MKSEVKGEIGLYPSVVGIYEEENEGYRYS
jgi:hypothetical protein